MQKFIVKITAEDFASIEKENLECMVLSEDLSSHFKKEFTVRAKAHNKLILGVCTDDVLAYNLDGMIIDLSKSDNIKKDYALATAHLKNKIVGAICRNRRHEAMLVSECEPDFVIFKAWNDGIEKVKDLSAWYTEMFLIQSAVMLMEDIDSANFVTDFVILSDKQCLI